MAGLFRRGGTPPDQEQHEMTDSGGSAVPPASKSSPTDMPAAEPDGHASPAYDPLEQGAVRSPNGHAPVASPTRPPNSRWKGLAAILAIAVAVAVVAAVASAAGGHSTASGTSTPGAAPTVVVPPATNDLQQNVISVIHVVQPSVVQITGHGPQGSDIGSGEILRSDGYIITNNHVVDGFADFTVTLANGDTVPAQVVGTAPQDDLAVLKVKAAHLRPISVGDSRAVQVGQFAVALGSPLGLQQSATIGIVSALDRQASEAQSGPLLVGLIQTSAPINPGNSGGALVDLQGRLIGIPTLAAENPESGTPAAGIGFAIPSDRMTFIADQLIQYGHVVNTGQGFLGIQGLDVTPQLATDYGLPVQSGVLVLGFAPDATGSSPAQAAGMQRGDIIVGVSGQPITNQSDLAAELLAQAPGARVLVTVQRGSGQQSLKVTLGERPVQP